MQDVQLGILMAVMPFFMEGEVHSAKSSWAIPSGVLHLVQVMLGFTFLLLTTRGLTTRKLDRFYRCVASLGGFVFHTIWQSHSEGLCSIPCDSLVPRLVLRVCVPYHTAWGSLNPSLLLLTSTDWLLGLGMRLIIYHD